MREILFKAKRIDNGEWVEGALFDGENYCVIGQQIKFSPYVENECKIVGYKVDKNTICQFTGLTDKHGNKIWENDLVDTDHYATKAHVVKYNYGSFYVGINGLLFHYNNVSEVIGNIFDNPELLKGGMK